MAVGEVIKEMIPFLMIPLAIMVLSKVFRIVRDIMQGAYLGDTIDEFEKMTDEIIKEEEQKINIDKDLEKYFNYKE